jgi:hypothetical protein
MDTDAASFPATVLRRGLPRAAIALASKLRTNDVVLASACLAVLLALFFFDIVFFGRTLSTSASQWGVMGSDPPYGYTGDPPEHNPYLLDPLAHAIGESNGQIAADSYRDFRLPIWDANTALGRPLLGSLDPWAANPFRVLVAVSSSRTVLDAFLAGRLLIAGLFTYLLAKRLGTSKLAAFAAAVAFTFSGFSMLYINGQPPDMAVLFPVTLYAFDLLFERRDPFTVAFASSATALAVLSGNPEGAFAILLFGGGYYLARVASNAYTRGSLRPVRTFLPLGACVVLGIALSAFVLVPFIELAGFLNLGGHSEHLHAPERKLGLTFDALRYLISLFVPYFDGPPTSSFQGGGWTGIRNYVGVAVPLLAFLGLANRRAMATGGWFFPAAAVLLVAKTYGVDAVNWVGHLPVFNVMFFAVYFAPAIAFSLAMLAAFGVDQITRGGLRGWHLLAGAAFLALLLGWLVWLNRGILDDIPGEHLAISLIFAGGALLAAVAVVAAGRWRLISPQVTALLIVGLIAAELFVYTIPTKGQFAGVAEAVYGRNDLPILNRPKRYDPFTEPPYVRSLGQDSSSFRVFSPDYILYPSTSGVYNIDDIRGYTATTVDRYLLYIQSFINPTVNQRYTGALLPPLRSETQPSAYAGNPLFDLLNVKYVIAGKGAALPEAYDHAFIDDVMAANVSPPGLSLRAYRIEGEDKPVLFQHPPRAISLPLTPAADSRYLLFSLAMDTQVWQRAGDGVQFDVSVVEGDTTHRLFSRWLDPKNDPADRRWIDEAVDLGEFVGKDVTLVLETTPGANSAWDWAGWGDLRLSASPDTPPDTAYADQFKIVYEGEVNIYQNLHAFPRAFIVHRALPADGMDAAVALMKDAGFDPASEAVVESDLTGEQTSALSASPESDGSAVELLRHADTEVDLRADMENAGLLVLGDTYYPGWKAYVDGENVPIYPTDVALRSVYLEPGEHTVEFRYDPASFAIGWKISMAALFVLFAYAAAVTGRGIIQRRRERRSAGPA